MSHGQLTATWRHICKLVGLRPADGATDRELLQQFASNNDKEAFEALVRRHGTMVLNVCRRILRDDHAADDAFQATFLVLARRAGAMHWQSSVANWLYGVAQRCALKARATTLRRQARENQSMDTAYTDTEGGQPLEAIPGSDDPVDTVTRRELHAVLDEELRRLPDKYRAPLILCYLEGKTNEEAARELGCPSGSMSRHLIRGRELLRVRLAHRGVALSAAGLLSGLTENATAATVPAVLLESTVEAAVMFAVGKATLTGVVSGNALVLAEGVLKSMFLTKLKFAVVLFLMVGLTGLGAGGLHQWAMAAKPTGPNTGHQAGLAAESTLRAEVPDPKVGSGKAPTQSLRAIMQTANDREVAFDPNTPLKEALAYLSDVYQFTVLIDTQAFRGIEEAAQVDVAPVQLPKMKGVSPHTILHVLLSQVKPAATYRVCKDYVEIIPLRKTNLEDWVISERQLIPRVGAHLVKRPLDQALQELSETVGINVILDGRVAETASKTLVSATLEHLPIDTAVRILADMADLKPVVMDDAIYVTTKANAEVLQAEQDKRRQVRKDLEKTAKTAEEKSTQEADDKPKK